MISEEAESALLAVKVGGLHVSLRNEDDIDVMEERGRATINTLLSSERRQVLENRRKNILVQAPPIVSPNVTPVPAMPGKQE